MIKSVFAVALFMALSANAATKVEDTWGSFRILDIEMVAAYSQSYAGIRITNAPASINKCRYGQLTLDLNESNGKLFLQTLLVAKSTSIPLSRIFYEYDDSRTDNACKIQVFALDPKY